MLINFGEIDNPAEEIALMFSYALGGLEMKFSRSLPEALTPCVWARLQH